MALEAIQEVAQAEARAKADRDTAAVQAKQRLLDAQRETRQMLDQARQQGRAQARQMMAQAEEQAAGLTQKVLEEAARDCEVLKRDARGRLDAAAQLIVERVVNR